MIAAAAPDFDPAEEACGEARARAAIGGFSGVPA
jgi:hypothetical protein